MDVRVEVTGGLANQLFQWSAGEILAQRFGANLLIDTRIVNRPWEWGLQLDEIVRDIRSTTQSQVVAGAWALTTFTGRHSRAILKRASNFVPRTGTVVRTYAEAEQELRNGRSVRLRGLFQDAQQLIRCREHIASIVKPGLDRVAGPTRVPAGAYAAMHVRRGDYVSVPEYSERFGVCSPAYFREALSRLDPTLPVYIASDDHGWVMNEFSDLAGRVRLYRGGNQFEDLRMLTNSAEIVMSNSTFSWWGAFLGRQATAICPQPWFDNAEDDQKIELQEWVRVAR